MRKRNGIGPVVALLGLASVAVWAQALPPAQMTMGDHTKIAFKHFHIDTQTGDSRFWGGVTVTAPAYNLQAGTVTMDGQTDATTGKVGYSQIVAEGDASTGMRVIGHFQQPAPLKKSIKPLQGRSYEMEADRIVYTPTNDATAKTVGTMDLTGHPVIYVTDPQQIVGRAPIVADHLTITLAKDAQGQVAVQSIDGDNGEADFTPIPTETHAHTQRP
jgi:hypothetical protein